MVRLCWRNSCVDEASEVKKVKLSELASHQYFRKLFDEFHRLLGVKGLGATE